MAQAAARAAVLEAVVAELSGAEEKLKLSMKCLEDEGCEHIAPAIAANNTATQMDLSCNSIGPAGVAALSGAFSANKVLSAVDLSANAVGDDGAVALAAALAANTSALTALDLHANSIGDKGAVALAEARTCACSLGCAHGRLISWSPCPLTRAPVHPLTDRRAWPPTPP